MEFSVRIDKEEEIMEVDAVNELENIKYFHSSDLLNLLESVNDLVESNNALKDHLQNSPNSLLEPAKQETGTT